MDKYNFITFPYYMCEWICRKGSYDLSKFILCLSLSCVKSIRISVHLGMLGVPTVWYLLPRVNNRRLSSIIYCFPYQFLATYTKQLIYDHNYLNISWKFGLQSLFVILLDDKCIMWAGWHDLINQLYYPSTKSLTSTLKYQYLASAQGETYLWNLNKSPDSNGPTSTQELLHQRCDVP